MRKLLPWKRPDYLLPASKGIHHCATGTVLKGNKVKCEVAAGQGQKQHDKRDATREKTGRETSSGYLR